MTKSQGEPAQMQTLHSFCYLHITLSLDVDEDSDQNLDL